MLTLTIENSVRDAHTLQPGEIVFNTMRYRSSEAVQRLGYFQRSVSYIKVQIMFKQKNNTKEKENVCKDKVFKTRQFNGKMTALISKLKIMKL